MTGERGPARVAGVAEALPPGERVLWQGGPRRVLVARHVLHVRVVAAYFAVSIGWWLVRAAPALPAARLVPSLALQLLLAAAVIGLVHGYAAMTARGATYVVTTRRVVLRVGAVLPVVVNVPLAQVTSAGLHRFRDGSGQIALQLDRAARASWWLLWPHVRPGRLRWPEPLLRGLAGDDAAAAAAALQHAVTELAATPPAEPALRAVDVLPGHDGSARTRGAGTPLAAA